MLSPELLLAFTTNKTEMITERTNKYILSFLGRNAIQEIRIELKTISRTATTKKVLVKNERLSSAK
jgi:hypothetical protein